MSRITTAGCAILLAACTGGGEQAESEMADAAAMPAAISLADVAGNWDVQTLAAASDSVIVQYQLTATDNMDGWTITLPEREPMPLRVLAVEGDSIVTEVGPFPSVLREGVMVTARSVSRLQEGRMTGTVTAHYQTTGADSVVTMRMRGRRAQQ